MSQVFSIEPISLGSKLRPNSWTAIQAAALIWFEKYGRYTGNFPQMPVYTGAPVFLRGTWAHCPLPQMQISPLPMV